MEIKIFECEEFGKIRTMLKNGDPWFVGKDVATILGYAKPENAVASHVDAEDKTTTLIQGTGSNYKSKVVIINESGLYALVLSSKLPQAREFKHWITAVVLPQIRKTGGYIPLRGDDGLMMKDEEIMARALLIMKRTIEQKEHLIEEQKPKVAFADAVTACDDSILIRDLAKLITQNGVNIGQGRLFYWLRLHGYLFQNETRPIQKWVEKGLFDTSITLIHTHHGTKERCTTKVTGKGQKYFVTGFLTGKFHAENGNF